jgi:hypothetical protein
MTPTNLAIVFAPIVMRYNTTDLQQLLKLSEWENEVLDLCIRHYHIVFEDASSVRANAIAANFDEELRIGGILLAKSLLQKVRTRSIVLCVCACVCVCVYACARIICQPSLLNVVVVVV